MAAQECYPGSPADPPRAGLEARVAEIERVVATLSSLRAERAAEHRDRPWRDPVALTAALHPGGRRSARAEPRPAAARGTLAVRFVIFEPTSTR